jgi:hypothetical protein
VDLNPPLKQIFEVLVTETEVKQKQFFSLRLGCEVSFVTKLSQTKTDSTKGEEGGLLQ